MIRILACSTVAIVLIAVMASCEALESERSTTEGPGPSASTPSDSYSRFELSQRVDSIHALTWSMAGHVMTCPAGSRAYANANLRLAREYAAAFEYTEMQLIETGFIERVLDRQVTARRGTIDPLIDHEDTGLSLRVVGDLEDLFDDIDRNCR